MTKSTLNSKYFSWMYQLVCGDGYSKGLSYRKLLRYLHRKEFTYDIPMDENRADDGIDLRYRFGYEHSVDIQDLNACFQDCPCSVLEMMVALAIRCEEHIMDDPDIGDRTGQWFWNMIVNLGLGHMDDSNFDSEYTDEVVRRLLNHQYDPDGTGGLFTLDNPPRDMRTIEIWYQMCWYLSEKMYG